MDAQIDRHLPLITARLVFAPKPSHPPPIITARMEFPSIRVPQRSPTPEVRTTPTRAATPRRPTPINTRIAATSEDKVDSTRGSPLTSVSSESDELESEEGAVSTKIPKPPGTVGRPQSGGYNLQDKLGWNDRTYQNIISLVHKLAKTRLDIAKSFLKQDKKKIKQICDAVRKEYPILKDYVRDWPTHDMLKLHLKYTSETARRSAEASRAKNIVKIATTAMV